MLQLKTVLDMSGAVSIITYLLECDDEPYISDLHFINDNHKFLVSVLERLQNDGVIVLKEQKVRRSRKVSLTEKGKQVAELLKQAEDLIND
ncbi:hypothetical protein [Candidatus Methanomassiliicoccus intestinalis]|jgi:hypothetical protein|uniref:hypothetical protein n=1 Tax=Candidatus Methanomassiliicoccus intestinalis TaxID=1406512 RepID=UPI0011C8F792|nr:hypothetical protein [Candidatus Methanomassiliicoccus intestinalis]